jgi:hypothetical protein
MPFRKNIAAWVGLLLISSSLGAQTIVGKYGEEDSHSILLEIKKDSTFTEINSLDVFYRKSTGKWKVKADTLVLDIKKVYAPAKNGKNTQITDFKDDYWKLSRDWSKYLIFQDSLVQIRSNPKLHQGYMLPKIEQVDTIDYKNFRHSYSKTDSIVSFQKKICYRLYNAKGKILLDECKISFCITHFPKGIYYLEIDKRAVELTWY